MKQYNNITMKKGVSLYLAILVLGLISGISLGLSALLIAQFKSIRGIEESVLAFCAADTGIEALLKTPVADTGRVDLSNGSFFEAKIRCEQNCLPENCIFGIDKVDSSCTAFRFCIVSVGTFKETKRAIKVRY